MLFVINDISVTPLRPLTPDIKILHFPLAFYFLNLDETIFMYLQ